MVGVALLFMARDCILPAGQTLVLTQTRRTYKLFIGAYAEAWCAVGSETLP
jgi:hypothetical protein